MLIFIALHNRITYYIYSLQFCLYVIRHRVCVEPAPRVVAAHTLAPRQAVEAAALQLRLGRNRLPGPCRRTTRAAAAVGSRSTADGRTRHRTAVAIGGVADVRVDIGSKSVRNPDRSGQSVRQLDRVVCAVPGHIVNGPTTKTAQSARMTKATQTTNLVFSERPDARVHLTTTVTRGNSVANFEVVAVGNVRPDTRPHYSHATPCLLLGES